MVFISSISLKIVLLEKFSFSAISLTDEPLAKRLSSPKVSVGDPVF
jgi:hypothetical protein